MVRIFFLLALTFGPAAAEECPATNINFGPLTHTAEMLAKNGELTIVAFGSSSTQGWMSTDAAHTYPAVLQSALSDALPNAHVAVINRGVGGQDAAEELPRIDSDVAALKPSLVIWQVGANGALRNTDPDIFRRLVMTGIDRLQADGIDVLMMDNQRAPMILATPEHARIDQILRDIADEKHTALFRRGELMAQWESAGLPADHFISSDGLHHNNLGYRCIALAVAQGIVRGAQVLPSAAIMTSAAQAPAASR